MKQAILLALAALCAGGAALAQHPQFPGVAFDLPFKGYPTSFYPNGIGPFAQRFADIDLDGRTDLVTVSWPTNARLSVLRGDGAAGFAVPQLYPLFAAARDVEVLDLDGDGDTDVLVPDTGGQWQGLSFTPWINSQGTLAEFAHVFASTTGKGAPNDLDCADFNLDGILDVACAHDKYIEYGNSAAIVLGAQGPGPTGLAFQQPPIYFTLPSGTNRIVARDFDSDGMPDLAIGYESNRVTLSFNNGLGFDPHVTLVAPPAGVVVDPALRAGDVDLDGDDDLLFSSVGTGGFNAGSIALYRWSGASFGAPELVPLGTGNGGVDIELADVTGDGWPDLAAPAQNAESWALVPADGQGGFGAAQVFHCGDDPGSIGAADLDGDGDRELVVCARQSLSANVYLNPGDGSFWQPPYVPMIDPGLAPASHSDIAGADIDGDQDLDLAVGYSANFVGVYGLAVRRNQGNGVFGALENYTQSSLPVHVRLWDFDGDARPELFWLDTAFSPRFHYKRNNGSGGFGTTVNGPNVYCDTADGDVASADVDADGDLDIGIANCLNSAYVHRWLGSSFAPAQVRSLSSYATALGFGDVNGDGFPDLATNSQPNQYLEIARGNGNGTFQAPVLLLTARGVNAIEFVDLNDDGFLDFAGSYKLDGGGATVCLGRGDGSFEPHVDYLGSYATAGDDLEVVDIDADGDRDLVAATEGELLSEGAQDVSVWRNLGDGQFASLERFGVGQPALRTSIADYDGDERLDLLVTTSPAEGAGGWYFPAFTLLRGLDAPWTSLGHALAGTGDELPLLGASPAPTPGAGFTVKLSTAAPASFGAIAVGASRLDLPLFGGLLVPALDLVHPYVTNAAGAMSKPYAWPVGLPAGTQFWLQAWTLDGGAAQSFSASNALVGTQP